MYAVNAGSNTVSVFAVLRNRLFLLQVVPSGGTFPVSVAVGNGVVYVLNARDGGSLQGYRVFFGHLLPLPGSTRQLGLDASATPEFVNTPGQVGFSPDGSKLIVTTKANGNDIDVFDVGLARLPLACAGGELRARDGAVRVHLRPGRKPRGLGGGHEQHSRPSR